MEAAAMRTKCFFFVFLISFLLSVFACQTTGDKRVQITCRPSPAAPSSAVEGGAITISWDPNKESALAGYRVYYGTGSGSYKSCVDVGNPPKSSSGLMEYTLTGLDKGEKYYIAVTAYDKNKDASGFSSEVSGVAK